MFTGTMLRLREWVWDSAVFLWVFAPILGFWENTHPRLAQYGLWVLASILVLAVSFLKRPVREVRIFHKLLLGCTLMFLMHLSNFSLGSSWLLKTAMVLTATSVIAEREEFDYLLQCLKACLILQIPIVVLEVFNVNTPWQSAGEGFAGSLYKRPGLSLLAGAVSIWSDGIVAYLAAFMACLSTSFVGAVPAVLRLVDGTLKRFRLLYAGVLLAVTTIAFPWILSTRLAVRVETWEGLSFLKQGWLTGWGFFPMPGVFQEDTGGTLGPLRMAHQVFSDYHNTFADWIGRFGLMGILVAFPVLAWVVKQTFRKPSNWKVWSFAFFIFSALLQSAEAFAVLSLLGAIWWIRLSQQEEIQHVVAV